jgi:molecular chaperone HtpG
MVLKEGFYMNWQFLDELKGLLRFASTHADSVTGLTSLKDYVGRMREGQKEIYLLSGDSIEAVRHSPHLEALEAKGYEVLFMTDPVDEWMLQFLRDFDGKQFKNIAAGDLDLADAADKKKVEEKSGTFGTLLAALKSRLSADVSEVRLTSLLTDSPARLVSEAGGPSAQMERMMRAAGQGGEKSKRILELNPDHAISKKALALQEAAGGAAGADAAAGAAEGGAAGATGVTGAQSAEAGEWMDYLYGQALLAEGSDLPDPGSYARLVNKLVGRGL